LFILFIFCECLLVVHLLASLVNSIHRNLLCQVAKLLSVVQHTVSVVSGLVVVALVRVVVGRLVVVALVRVVIGRLVVVALVRVVVTLVRVVVGLSIVDVAVVAVVGLGIVVGGLVVTPGSHAILITGIFEGVVQRRRSVEIIISLVGVCLIIHLV
tara:strand:- start:3233 stop:3700 length:468 start_codon:yes stop_codon:yes gene_type:complete